MGLKADKLPVPSESTEQRNLFAWAAMQSAAWPQLRLLYHVPNGGYRTAAEAARFRAEGVRPGVPDLCLPVARKGYHGLYIELKRRRGGRASEEQVWWLTQLRDEGYCAAICCGWEEAAAHIMDYLRG